MCHDFLYVCFKFVCPHITPIEANSRLRASPVCPGLLRGLISILSVGSMPLSLHATIAARPDIKHTMHATITVCPDKHTMRAEIIVRGGIQDPASGLLRSLRCQISSLTFCILLNAGFMVIRVKASLVTRGLKFPKKELHHGLIRRERVRVVPEFQTLKTTST